MLRAKREILSEIGIGKGNRLAVAKAYQRKAVTNMEKHRHTPKSNKVGRS
jgi:hypothetical protein